MLEGVLEIEDGEAGEGTMVSVQGKWTGFAFSI